MIGFWILTIPITMLIIAIIVSVDRVLRQRRQNERKAEERFRRNQIKGALELKRVQYNGQYRVVGRSPTRSDHHPIVADNDPLSSIPGVTFVEPPYLSHEHRPKPEEGTE